MPSPAIYLLSPSPHEGTKSFPMIQFHTIATQIAFQESDTLLFTSKQAVKVADSIDKRWKKYPAIAIGEATKKEIERLGGEVIYTPKAFYGEVLSHDIATFFHHRKLLYLRPKVISFDAKAFLARAGIVLQEQILYETVCIPYPKDAQPPDESIIIFTSPSTIHCFLKQFTWLDSYSAVVIGEATKVHLPPQAHAFVADRPLIHACIQKAQEILLSSKIK